jgi:hypothetical protein
MAQTDDFLKDLTNSIERHTLSPLSLVARKLSKYLPNVTTSDPLHLETGRLNRVKDDLVFK